MENYQKPYLISFDVRGDERGSLVAIENLKNIPFEIKRIYYIFDTKKKVRRGFHAHKILKQVLICVSGSCQILLDDGKSKQTIFLNTPQEGLYIEGLVWREMFNFSIDCVLLVLADDVYNETDYIRDYENFKENVRENDSNCWKK
ncbi:MULTISPECIES: sugar 3,4-ketoisomerase [Acinetobacter]|uniref:FdtA/QdtA family cupin domain-containing protein n=1 Tax=Acinetobacter corruptisaponis TaxID=3045147 RepID=A0ABY8S1F5_9GAMM|nr:FdtA/QdtA family cupin domain-containing protein [Acinetobacter sp. KCTC 92772]WHP04863.1 FdtA/QdtA family cupin domain-containing protein [Acinetobacter sp. KCTC 92772]